MNKKVVIIGAGMIGTSTALRLAQKGVKVVLVDRSFVDQPASGGNAGIIAYSDIFPMISGKLLLKVPFWLLDKRAMISLSPSHAFKMIPWFWELLKSTTPGRRKGYIPAKMSLMKTALQDYYEQIDEADRVRFIKENGLTYVYSSKKRFDADESSRLTRAQYGYQSEIFSEKETYQRVDGLETNVYKSVFEPENANLTSPMGMLNYFRDKCRGLGVEFITGDVGKIRRTGETIFVDLKEQDSIEADELVVTAGAFSRKLVNDLGFDVPLDTERGYNTTIENPPFELTTNIIARDKQIAFSSFDEGLRVGGGVEFSGIDAAPNYERIDTIIALAQELFPSIPANQGVKWMGCRPSMADDLPVIGRHPRDRRVSFAFGHGHLGMTMAAVSAKHITNLIVDDKTDVDLSPFRVDRF